MEKELQRLQERRRQVLAGGGEAGREEQHRQGKHTARERIAMFLDEGSFMELGTFMQGGMEEVGGREIDNPGEGVVTGCGTVDGRPVYLFAQDFTVAVGSLGWAQAQKICRIIDLAGQNGVPLVGLHDSGGVRLQEGIAALDGYGSIFRRHARYSGVVPQLSVIMGPCAGGAVYSPALSDFVFMIDQIAHMFTAGPAVIRAATGEKVALEELGGAAAHNSLSGAAHFFAENEEEGLKQVRTLLSYLPPNNVEDPPAAPPQDPPLDQDKLTGIIPGPADKGYDVREVIRGVVDGGIFFEVHERYARNAVAGFSRLAGAPVGIVANQALVRGGYLDIDAAVKISRFICFCDSFNLPLITFVDAPGFLPGAGQERGGAVWQGAKIIYAYAEATVPQISVVLHRAYGSAYVAMGSRSLGADLCLAWPTAEISALEPAAAVEIIDGRELDGAENPEEMRRDLARRYRHRLANPYVAAARGWIDEVIEPQQTRDYLCRALGAVGRKRVQRPPRKHGHIPL